MESRRRWSSCEEVVTSHPHAERMGQRTGSGSEDEKFGILRSPAERKSADAER